LLFKRRPLQGLQVLILVLLALSLMLMDQHWQAFHRLRNRLDVVVYPIQAVVDFPIKVVHWMSSTVENQHELLADNARLRAHEFLLQAKLQKLLVVERENAQLKELLKSTNYVSGKVLVAQLLAVSLDSALQQVILNKGHGDHVYVGQPVLDAYGVMGQIIDVGEVTSKVLLLTDKRAAIPVEDYRNGVRSVAIGDGKAGSLSLINVVDTADIKVGDLFVSSGLGLRYPVGYPVGVVTSVHKSSGKNFASIELKPSAHMDRTQQVLLTWPENAHLVSEVRQQLKAKQT
jgi:rod shape-determining protein MreC